MLGQVTGDIMTDYQFRSIIKMVLAIARKTTDVNTVIKELEKLLPKDEREEGENVVEEKK